MDRKEDMIVDQIMTDIERGKYNVETKLPSEHTIADDFKVPRIVVRKAFKRLEDRGYLVAIQGKGRYVAERMNQIDMVMSGDESFTSKMNEKGYDFKTENIFCEKLEDDSYIFKELGLNREQDIYKIGRLRILNGKPAAIHTSYVSKDVFEDIDMEGSSILSMFSYYKSKGYQFFYSEKSILSITFPSILEQDIFGCTGMIPLLKVETNCRDKDSGKILEYTKIVYRGDYFKYIIK